MRPKRFVAQPKSKLKVLFSRMNIEIWEVIDVAKTKPFGFQAFYPGPGLGGHCIPIDPFYLSWLARKNDLSTRFIEPGRLSGGGVRHSRADIGAAKQMLNSAHTFTRRTTRRDGTVVRGGMVANVINKLQKGVIAFRLNTG